MGKHSKKKLAKLRGSLGSFTSYRVLVSLSAGAVVVISATVTISIVPQSVLESSTPSYMEQNSVQTSLASPSDDTTPPVIEPQRPTEGALSGSVTSLNVPAPTSVPSTAQRGAQTGSEVRSRTPVPTTQRASPTRTRETTRAPSRDSQTANIDKRCTGIGLVSNVVTSCDTILDNISGVSEVGGRAGRSNASCHPQGRAIDFMVFTNREVGDSLAKYVLDNQKDLGVSLVIWRQRINFGSGWEPMTDRGGITANHFDHVHISFFPCQN